MINKDLGEESAKMENELKNSAQLAREVGRLYT